MNEPQLPESPLEIELARIFPGIPVQDRPRFAKALASAEPYLPGSDSLPRDDVPCGALSRRRHCGRVFYPQVERDYWVYVPRQYDTVTSANLMVFLDGARYLNPEINVPVVLDNLIDAGEIPVTIAVFVQPGERGPGLPIYGGSDNRSLEYDALGDHLAHFLYEEFLPAATTDLNVSVDPARRAICGLSSGGIAAFNVAWEMPHVFARVISHCGSFVDIRGGNALPSMIRRSPAKPLRVFLQTGSNDLDITFGHWLLANQEMAAALAYRGYDHRLIVGEGGHSLKHGGAIFPDTLRWLWRE